MSRDEPRVSLIDEASDTSRTPRTILASLKARLGALQLLPAATALGSLAAGFVALGQEVGRTVDGMRMRKALERSRVGANGELIWEALGIGAWVSSVPPSSVLDQLRNDIALLLVDGLNDVLDLGPDQESSASPPPAKVVRGSFYDFAIGFWVFSREAAEGVEALAGPTLDEAGYWERGPEGVKGPLLR